MKDPTGLKLGWRSICQLPTAGASARHFKVEHVKKAHAIIRHKSLANRSDQKWCQVSCMIKS